MTGTSSRLLQLLSLLQRRRDWSGNELARRLEVSGRTIRRDIDRLRELGYPVEAVSGPSGGYRLHAGVAMPPLLLDDDEAVAIVVGLRTAASASVTGIEETAVRALVKLEGVMPSRLRRRVNALQSATVTLSFGSDGPTVDPKVLTVIAAACRDTERLRFAYGDRKGAETRRCVEPRSLVNLGRRWYLVAWDCDRRDWRTFRVDRLAGPTPDGSRFVPRTLPRGDAAAYVRESLTRAPHRYQARLTLHAPATEVTARVPNLWGAVEPTGELSCEYRTSDDSLDWLVARIGTLGVDFDVHEPPELADRFRELGARYARAAGPRPRVR
jgi:predicted DNA-binding transcriptional regulator YafY